MNCNSYGRMLKRVSTALSAPEKETVGRIFSWLICTRRPLRTVELEHALMIQLGDNDLQPDRKLFKDVVELCGPIVEKRKEYITFVHFSAKEYSPKRSQNPCNNANRCSLDISPRRRPGFGTAFRKLNAMLRSL